MTRANEKQLTLFPAVLDICNLWNGLCPQFKKHALCLPMQPDAYLFSKSYLLTCIIFGSNISTAKGDFSNYSKFFFANLLLRHKKLLFPVCLSFSWIQYAESHKNEGHWRKSSMPKFEQERVGISLIYGFLAIGPATRWEAVAESGYFSFEAVVAWWAGWLVGYEIRPFTSARTDKHIDLWLVEKYLDMKLVRIENLCTALTMECPPHFKDSFNRIIQWSNTQSTGINLTTENWGHFLINARGNDTEHRCKFQLMWKKGLCTLTHSQ